MDRFGLIRIPFERRLTIPGLLVASEALLAALLGLFQIGNKSFWHDEGASYTFTRLDWSELWSVMAEREANQGLFYVLLKPWSTLGEAEAILRSLATIFAVATIPLTYALGARLFGTRLGLVAALLMAVNAFFVHYAQEARAYSLLLFLLTGSSLMFVVCVEQASRLKWFAYACFSALAVYAHLFAVLVLLSQGASLVFRGSNHAPWKSFLFAAVLAGILAIPILLFALFRDVGQIDWVATPSARDVAAQFVRLSGGRAPVAVYFVACASAVVVSVRVWLGSKASPDTWRYAFLLSWLLLPFTIVIIVSQFKPILVTRYMMICLPPLVLLAALGVSQLQNQRWFVAALAVVVLFSLAGVASWYADEEKDNWRDATNYVLDRSQPGDAAIFYLSLTRNTFDYYRDRRVPDDSLTYVDHETGVVVEQGSAEPSNQYLISETLIDDLRKDYERVWLVLSFDLLPSDPERIEISQRLETSLGEHFLLQYQEAFRGVRVFLYDVQ